MRFATFLTAIALTGASPSPSPCPYSVDYAAYQAYGTAKDSAEYIAYLSGGDGTPYTASFIVFSPSGSETASVQIPGVRVGTPPVRSAALFVTHRQDVVWIQLASVTTADGRTYPNCDVPYAIPQIAWTATPSYDDAASWIDPTRVTGIAVTPPTPTSLIEPDLPEFARKAGLIGTCIVALEVESNGSVEDAELVTSSGWPQLDAAALKAANAQSFSPARLPRALGGTAIGAVIFEQFTYSPGMVTVGPA
jgi:TonB family protein